MPQAIPSALPRDVPCLRVPAVTLENVSRRLKIEKGRVGIKIKKRIKIKEEKNQKPRAPESKQARNQKTFRATETLPAQGSPWTGPGREH